MKKILIIFLFIIATIGCATQGQLSTLPKVKSQTTACDVFVIRKSTIYGGALIYTFGIDHQDIVALASGNYVTFKVDSGTHIASVKYPRQLFLGTAQSSLEFECISSNEVYIYLWPGLAVNMELLQEEEGSKLIQNAKLIDLK
ncbi:hypothetical protein [Desulfosarcina ovata]|nr:hypothetical protein [Desulfosarcina ovata]